MKKKTLTTKSGKVKELTSKDIRAMKSAAEVLPKKLLAALPKRKQGERGKQKSPTKILVSKRYDPAILEYFKSTGQGWQSLIDNILLDYIKKHPKTPKNDPQHKLQKRHKNLKQT
jgi:uncharacterized protein (DUF4415 family)